MDEQTQAVSTQDSAQITIDTDGNIIGSSSPNYGSVVGIGGLTGSGSSDQYQYSWAPTTAGDPWQVGYIDTTGGSYYATNTLASINYDFTSDDLDRLKKVLLEVEKQLNKINESIKTAPLEHLELYTQFKDSLLNIRRPLRDLLVDCQLAEGAVPAT